LNDEKLGNFGRHLGSERKFDVRGRPPSGGDCLVALGKGNGVFPVKIWIEAVFLLRPRPVVPMCWACKVACGVLSGPEVNVAYYWLLTHGENERATRKDVNATKNK